MSEKKYAQEILAIATTVSERAAALLLGAVDNVVEIREKSTPKDLVTEWDHRVEDLIRRELAVLSPGVAILAEEGGGEETSGGERWLIDPIDGTVNFSHGLPWYAISIGFEKAGQPIAGVVNAPAQNRVFSAASGHGASCNGVSIAVSSTEKLSRALLVTGFPYDRATTKTNFAQWEHMQCHAGACRRLGAASLDMCSVAMGWSDGYWEVGVNAWDVAAGAVIVREAGGVVTGITGDEFAARNGAALASNGAIHKEFIEELSRVTPALV